ncbi:MAG: alpha/beta hydrolase [Pseudomonadota bacterium]
MKSILTILLIGGGIYLLLIAAYALKQRSLIYYPTVLELAEAEHRASAWGVSPWMNDAGDWLGWTMDTSASTPGPRRRALVFHGNAGMALDRTYYASLLSEFTASGPWQLYVFEYPGYGPRTGAPGEDTFTAAAADAVDDLLAQDTDPLLIIGESIGSGVASAVARDRPDAVAALMLITPFDSLVNTARHHMPFLPIGLLLRDRYDNLEALRDFRQPLIVITAGQDTIVPTERAEPLLAQHQGRMHHSVQPNAGHNSLQFDPFSAGWRDVDAFLAENSR